MTPTGAFIARGQDDAQRSRRQPGSVHDTWGFGVGAGVAHMVGMTLRNILVPTDLSPLAEPALALAAGIARRSSARLTLAHADAALDIGVVASEPIALPPQLSAGLLRYRTERSEAALQQAARTVPDDVACTTVIRLAEVVTGILDVAVDGSADLIVMGSHGRGASRFLLGSVAAKVARSAPCPVLIVRRSPAPTATQVRFQRALVAIDYSAFSRVSARFAAQLVDAAGNVELMHVWHDGVLPDELFASSHELAELTERSRAGAADRLSRFAADLDLPRQTSTYLGQGSVGRAILDRANETGADLVVVGAHARPTLGQRLLGTTADSVLRHAACPVLVIPDTALSQADVADRRASRSATR